MDRAINLTFHGVGEPPRRLDPGEAKVWVSHERFLSILDSVEGRTDVRISFDDGNVSDVNHALPALRERGLKATFFVVAGRLGAPCFLDAAAVEELAAAGMTIGSHGMRHRAWRGLDDAALREELVDSKAILESVVGKPVTQAACPFGAYDRRVLRRLRGSGYDHVYTSDRGTTRSREFLQARNSIGPDDEPTVLERIAALESSPRRALPRRVKLAVKRWRSTTATRAAISVRPIAPDDVPAVAEFLHANLNERVTAGTWARALDVPWNAAQPNAGFMLLEGEDVVGAHLAFYSERTIDGRRERFCNLGAWCVLPEHRFHALRLLKALLAQDGYHFTDLSPSGSVVGLNTRLGFSFLDTTTTVVPNLPWLTRPGRDTISSNPELLDGTLTGDELRLYRDHAGCDAARHLLLMRGERWCYVLFRKDRRKGLPLFASILHVSDPELFRAMSGPLARHLLFHHGAAATLVERAVADHRPRLSLTVESPRRKMFRSPSLEAADIDYLYSELVCLSW